jgi:hypothetical protein
MYAGGCLMAELDEIIVWLQNFKDEVPKNVQKAIKDSEIAVVARAKMNCTPGMSPYDAMRFGKHMGRTGNSITAGGISHPLKDSGAPFETGLLRRSNFYSDPTMEGDTIVAKVYNNCDYAVYVHEGTSKMAPRPFLMDAVLSEQEATEQRIVDAVNEAAGSMPQ